MGKDSFFKRCNHFLQHGVWEISCLELPLYKRLGVYAVRLVSLVVSGFKSDECTLHAASLTYFSLMALIPVLALTLTMARAFGGAHMAKEQFDKQLDGWMQQFGQQQVLATPGDPPPQSAGAAQGESAEGETAEGEAGASQQEMTQNFTSQIRQISDKIFTQIDELKFGTLGGIGAVMLLWMVISTLGKVEASFNRVWGVERPRPLVRKCFDYLGVSLILPFLVTAASSVPVAAMITRFMAKTVGGGVSEALGALLESGLFKMSVTMLTGTLTFAFLLGFMPNTRVKMQPALIGGFVTMALFGLWLKLCAMLQIGIGKYSILYGSFAVLPILLLWVYTSWQIILLGAEITFALQNRDTYVLEQNAAGASLRARLLLALTLCAETARQALATDGGPFAAEEFARTHGIPSRFVKEVLDELVRNQVMARVAGSEGDYLLYRCGSSLTVAEVIRVMIDDGKPLAALGLGALSASVLDFNRDLGENIEERFRQPVAALSEVKGA